MSHALRKFFALLVLCGLFAASLNSAASCGPPDSGAGNALEFDDLDEELALEDPEVQMAFRDPEFNDFFIRREFDYKLPVEKSHIQDPTIPCYEKHICAYRCSIGSDVIFYDLDNEKNPRERNWLLKMYKSKCRTKLQASVDSVINNAMNNVITRYFATISFQLKNALYYKDGKFVVPRIGEIGIPLNSDEQREQSLFQFMSEISATKASASEEKAINNLGVPALLKGDTQALSGLKSLLLDFVSDSTVVHLCSKAQIKGGNYSPSETLLNIWESFFNDNAHKYNLKRTDYNGLNVTALGQTVIMETVSAYSAPCYCSELFPASSNIYKAGLERLAINSCPSEMPLFLSKSFFVKFFEWLVDFFKDIGKYVEHFFGKGWKDIAHYVSEGWKDIAHYAGEGWKDVAHGAVKVGKDVEHFFGSGWKDVEHGAAKVGKDVAHDVNKGVKDVERGAAKVGKYVEHDVSKGWKDVEHGAVKVGKDVAHDVNKGVKDVEHGAAKVGKDVEHDVSKAAKDVENFFHW